MPVVTRFALPFAFPFRLRFSLPFWLSFPFLLLLFAFRFRFGLLSLAFAARSFMFSAHAKIKMCRFDRVLGRGAILAHDVRNFRLRAVQGKDDGTKQAHREGDGNQDDDENSLERQKGAVDECHEGLSFYPGARQKGRKRNGEV